jgi:hypothetical protein
VGLLPKHCPHITLPWSSCFPRLKSIRGIKKKCMAHKRSTLVGMNISLHLLILRVPYFSYEKHFIALGIPRRASRRFIIWVLSFASYIPSEPSAPSSHEMRYYPFLCQCTQKSQKMRKRNGKGMEGDKYDQEWTMIFQGTRR